jgi:hypothetical protein
MFDFTTAPFDRSSRLAPLGSMHAPSASDTDRATISMTLPWSPYARPSPGAGPLRINVAGLETEIERRFVLLVQEHDARRPASVPPPVDASPGYFCAATTSASARIESELMMCCLASSMSTNGRHTVLAAIVAHDVLTVARAVSVTGDDRDEFAAEVERALDHIEDSIRRLGTERHDGRRRPLLERGFLRRGLRTAPDTILSDPELWRNAVFAMVGDESLAHTPRNVRRALGDRPSCFDIRWRPIPCRRGSIRMSWAAAELAKRHRVHELAAAFRRGAPTFRGDRPQARATGAACDPACDPSCDPGEAVEPLRGLLESARSGSGAALLGLQELFAANELREALQTARLALSPMSEADPIDEVLCEPDDIGLLLERLEAVS